MTAIGLGMIALWVTYALTGSEGWGWLAFVVVGVWSTAASYDNYLKGGR